MPKPSVTPLRVRLQATLWSPIDRAGLCASTGLNCSQMTRNRSISFIPVAQSSKARLAKPATNLAWRKVEHVIESRLKEGVAERGERPAATQGGTVKLE